MPDGHVNATDAVRNFPELLRDVENGATVTITKDGRPVAVLAPTPPAATVADAGDRARMRAMLERGLPLGFTGGVDRDEAHRRGKVTPLSPPAGVGGARPKAGRVGAVSSKNPTSLLCNEGARDSSRT